MEHRELGSMAEKLDEYEKLLREISPHMHPIMKQRITKALDRVYVLHHNPIQSLRLHIGVIPSDGRGVRIACQPSSTRFPTSTEKQDR